MIPGVSCSWKSGGHLSSYFAFQLLPILPSLPDFSLFWKFLFSKAKALLHWSSPSKWRITVECFKKSWLHSNVLFAVLVIRLMPLSRQRFSFYISDNALHSLQQKGLLEGRVGIMIWSTSESVRMLNDCMIKGKFVMSRKTKRLRLF